MTLLRCTNVHLTFGGLVALDGVSISIAPGEIVGIGGANGCGKSTLLNVISGHIRPDRGTVEFACADVTAVGPSQRAAMGMARSFQIARLMDPLPALDNILLGLHGSGMGRRRSQKARATAALELMEMTVYADRPVRAMSHGQRRRVELARALVADPRLLLLDEPTAGLSDRHTASLMDVLRDRARDGMAIIIVAHEPDILDALCTSVITMDAGTICDVGRYDATAEDPTAPQRDLRREATA